MIYEYKGYRGQTSRCDIQIKKKGGVFIVVLATELADNPGTSITIMVEDLAREICVKNSIPFNRLVWIEHYPEMHSPLTGLVSEATYCRVTFESDRDTYLKNPTWTQIPRENVDALMGQDGRMSKEMPDLWQQIIEETGVTDIETIYALVIEALLMEMVTTGDPETFKKYQAEMFRYREYKMERNGRE